MHNNTLFSKDFALVAAGQIVSLFGNYILRYALPLYLLHQTGSSALFGAVLAFSFVPMILLFPVGGIIADRVNKRTVMVVLDFCTAVLIALFLLLSGAMDLVPLMAITMMLLYGIQGAYQPAVKASVPALVGTERLVQANSVVDLISSLASMVGPVIGGILYSVVGLQPILYLSIVCFFASAVMELFIRIPFEKKPSSGNIFAVGLDDLKGCFWFLFRERPVLWKVSLAFACVNLFLTSLILIGLPVLITQRLNFGPDAANRLYGYAQGAVAAGAVLGGVLAGTFAKKLRAKMGPFLLAGCAVSVLIGGVALHALNGSMGIYIALTIGSSLLVTLSTLFAIQLMSFVQILTPQDMTGKVISCVMCVCMCTSPLGQFLYGIVFETIGNRAYLPFYGAALLVLAISLLTRRIFAGIDLLIEQHQGGRPVPKRGSSQAGAEHKRSKHAPGGSF